MEKGFWDADFWDEGFHPWGKAGCDLQSDLGVVFPTVPLRICCQLCLGSNPIPGPSFGFWGCPHPKPPSRGVAPS